MEKHYTFSDGRQLVQNGPLSDTWRLVGIDGAHVHYLIMEYITYATKSHNTGTAAGNP